MLHHDAPVRARLHAERHAAAARRRPPVDAGELERAVLAASAGDSAAWSAILDRFSGGVRAVARRHRLGAHDVEDVVQTTWLRLLQHIGRVREPAAIGAWLETTARRECLQIIRSAQRERPTDTELEGGDAAPAVDEARLVEADRRRAVRGAVERLPSHQRRLMTLLLAEPAPSYSDIAHALDMPIGSIGPTRGRALSGLRSDADLIRRLSEDVETC
jgi:RNA polymerase sigma factor (sigma-70 family)